MNELIPVNITIGDRSYRLKIEPSDEETLRKASKLINEKIIEFRGAFAGKDMQDFIAMVLIWFTTDQKKTEHEGAGTTNAIEKLAQMEDMIDKALKNNISEG